MNSSYTGGITAIKTADGDLVLLTDGEAGALFTDDGGADVLCEMIPTQALMSLGRS